MQGSEPPFIAGLRSAKKILLELRTRKIKQQQINQHQSPKKTSPPKPQCTSSSKHYSNKSPPQPLEPELPSHEIKTNQLRQKINLIGSQLFQCYCQNQSYEVILNHLANHYADHKHIVDQNQKLKRKAYELHENIEDYKSRIRKNYEIIYQQQKQTHQVKTLAGEQLRAFLLSEAEKAEQKPHDRLPLWLHSISKLQGWKQPEGQTEPQGKISLRFQNLSKQVVRKPVRKAQVQQQDIRRSFYHSELYTL